MQTLNESLSTLAQTFVLQSYGIFNHVDMQISNNCTSPDDTLALVQTASEDMRKILVRELIGNMKEAINMMEEQGIDPVEIAILDEFVNVVYSVEKFWHMCELFMVGSSDRLYKETIFWLKTSLLEYNVEQYVDEFTDNGVGSALYWDVVLKLCFQGQVCDAWRLLSMLSEIKQDRTVFQKLELVFLSFPCDLSNSSQSHAASQSFLRSWSEEDMKVVANQWLRWRESVQNIRSTASQFDFSGNATSLPSTSSTVDHLCDVFPSLNTILNMFCGMSIKEREEERLHDSWMMYSLSSLLFDAPPYPITHVSIAQSLVHAMDCCPVASPDDPVGGMSESSRRKIYKSILQANVGSAIKCIFETDGYVNALSLGAANSSFGDNSIFKGSFVTSIVGLLSATHLSVLLNVAGVLNLSDDMSPVNSTAKSVPKRADLYDEKDYSFVVKILLETAEVLNSHLYPVEVVSGYLSSCPELVAVQYAEVLFLRRAVSTDEDAFDVSQALRTFGLTTAAASVQLVRGTFWLNQKPPNVTKAAIFYQRGECLSSIHAVVQLCSWQCLSSAMALLSHSMEDKSTVGLHLKLPHVMPLIRQSNHCNLNMASSIGDINTVDSDRSLLSSLDQAESVLYSANVLAYFMPGQNPSFFSPPVRNCELSEVLFEHCTDNSVEFLRLYCCTLRWLMAATGMLIKDSNNLSEAGLSDSFGPSVTERRADEATMATELLRKVCETLNHLMSREIAPLRYCLHLMELIILTEDMCATVGEEAEVLCSRQQVESCLGCLQKVLLSPCTHQMCHNIAPENIAILERGLLKIWKSSVLKENKALRSANVVKDTSVRLSHERGLLSPYEIKSLARHSRSSFK